ncbi:MAG: gamma-glutamylcyclotransferase [Geminicoccaceae bacterium]|nr:MAG: gamma-glutamylcyclotransferase [Geminicoccaceae bacterium]
MTLPRRRWLVLVVILLAAPFLVLRYAPVHLPARSEAAPPVLAGPHDVFGYATLANPWVRFWVVGRLVPGEPATLEGWRREGRDLIPDAEGVTEGVVFTVAPAGLVRLDRFEETGTRYQRFRVILADGRDAWVYRLVPLAPPLEEVP